MPELFAISSTEEKFPLTFCAVQSLSEWLLKRVRARPDKSFSQQNEATFGPAASK